MSLLTGPVASYFLIGLSPSLAVFSTNFLTLFLLSFIFVLVAKTASHALPTFELAQSVTGVISEECGDLATARGHVSMPTCATYSYVCYSSPIAHSAYHDGFLRAVRQGMSGQFEAFARHA